MNLILLLQDEAASGIIELPADDRRAKHIVSILKPEAGTKLRVGVLGGGKGVAATSILEGGAVRLELGMLDQFSDEPGVELLLAAPRPKVLKRLWKPFAELGLRRVTLVNASRVEKAYLGPPNTAPEVCEPLLREGLEQAVDTWMPEVRVEKRLKPFVEDLDILCPRSEVLRLLCHPGGDASVTEAIAAAPPDVRRVVLAVGPEGGWIDFELDMFEQQGFQKVSLGPRVLTTSTAVMSLVALASDALRAKARVGRLQSHRQGASGCFLCLPRWPWSVS